VRDQQQQVRDVVPRLALSKSGAAKALGVSVDFLEEHVLRELRIVRRCRRRLIPIRELERWLAHSAALAVGDQPAI
jgi:hypothetical protein